MSFGLSVLGVLAAGVLLWSPYFINFSPQQNEVLWVPEHLRTHMKDFFTIYGLFAMVLTFAFIPVCSKVISKWLVSTVRWRDFEDFVDAAFDFLTGFFEAENAVLGMLSLGIAFLAAIFVPPGLIGLELIQTAGLFNFWRPFHLLRYLGRFILKRKLNFGS